MHSSKLLSKIISLGLVAGALASGLAYADDDRYFIANRSGVVIDELYLSATGEKDWGSDILGAETMANGESGEVTFAHDDDRCLWDLAIKDENGNELEWNNIDLCQYTRLTLKPGGVVEMK